VRKGVERATTDVVTEVVEKVTVEEVGRGVKAEVLAEAVL
jgi:hypothetical protein